MGRLGIVPGMLCPVRYNRAAPTFALA
jgi:hypothetical protein